MRERDGEAEEERPTVIEVRPGLDHLGTEEGHELPALEREALKERWTIIRHGPREVGLLDVEVICLERVAVLDRAVSVPIRLDVTCYLAGVELQAETRDEPPVAGARCGELPENGDAVVVVLQRVQRDQAARTRPVEVPRIGLREPETEVDLGRVLDRLLRRGDVVVLEVPERVEERVPLAARGIGRGLGYLIRAR